MNLTENIQPDKTEIEAVKPIKKELKLLGTIRPHKGHTMYQLNLAAGEISEAVFEEITASFKGGPVKRKLIVKQGFIYQSALNKKNAEKKFKKRLAAWYASQLVKAAQSVNS